MRRRLVAVSVRFLTQHSRRVDRPCGACVPSVCFVSTSAPAGHCFHDCSSAFCASTCRDASTKPFRQNVRARHKREGQNSDMSGHRMTGTNITRVLFLQDDTTFTIIYGDMLECLDLLAPSAEVANIWVTGLVALINQGARHLALNSG